MDIHQYIPSTISSNEMQPLNEKTNLHSDGFDEASFASQLEVCVPLQQVNSRPSHSVQRQPVYQQSQGQVAATNELGIVSTNVSTEVFTIGRGNLALLKRTDTAHHHQKSNHPKSAIRSLDNQQSTEQQSPNRNGQYYTINLPNNQHPSISDLQNSYCQQRGFSQTLAMQANNRVNGQPTTTCQSQYQQNPTVPLERSRRNQTHLCLAQKVARLAAVQKKLASIQFQEQNYIFRQNFNKHVADQCKAAVKKRSTEKQKHDSRFSVNQTTNLVAMDNTSLAATSHQRPKSPELRPFVDLNKTKTVNVDVRNDLEASLRFRLNGSESDSAKQYVSERLPQIDHEVKEKSSSNNVQKGINHIPKPFVQNTSNGVHERIGNQLKPFVPNYVCGSIDRQDHVEPTQSQQISLTTSTCAGTSQSFASTFSFPTLPHPPQVSDTSQHSNVLEANTVAVSNTLLHQQPLGSNHEQHGMPQSPHVPNQIPKSSSESRQGPNGPTFGPQQSIFVCPLDPNVRLPVSTDGHLPQTPRYNFIRPNFVPNVAPVTPINRSPPKVPSPPSNIPRLSQPSIADKNCCVHDVDIRKPVLVSSPIPQSFTPPISAEKTESAENCKTLSLQMSECPIKVVAVKSMMEQPDAEEDPPRIAISPISCIESVSPKQASDVVGDEDPLSPGKASKKIEKLSSPSVRRTIKKEPQCVKDLEFNDKHIKEEPHERIASYSPSPVKTVVECKKMSLESEEERLIKIREDVEALLQMGVPSYHPGSSKRKGLKRNGVEVKEDNIFPRKKRHNAFRRISGSNEEILVTDASKRGKRVVIPKEPHDINTSHSLQTKLYSRDRDIVNRSSKVKARLTIARSKPLRMDLVYMYNLANLRRNNANRTSCSQLFMARNASTLKQSKACKVVLSDIFSDFKVTQL